jgi:serine/threonine protein kinase
MVILARMANPTKIGRYIIKSELGRGGMAAVYRAYDPSFDRDVAIKVFPREMVHNLPFRALFAHEIKTVAKLEHPSIVPVYDVGEEDGQSYFVMRFMAGGPLSVLIANGKIPLKETARIVEKIAQGLAYAHKEKIIHCDLKPGNILFDDNGDPFISDFGIAKLIESTGSLTESGVTGTPAYMSPEQKIQGNKIDSRSDIYSLGVIVFQMLSGQQPQNTDTPMGREKLVTGPVFETLNTIPGLPFEVDVLIKKSMAKDKTKRYSTALELAKALNLAAFGNEGNITTASQSSRGRAGLAVTGIVLLVVVVGFFLLRNQLFVPQIEPALAPSPTAIPTKIQTEIPTETPTATLIPTPVPVTEVASPLPFAPACSSGIAIPTPIVKETNKACVKKIPYTLVSIPEGATFESLNPDLSCLVETTSNGKTIISCGGQQLFSYKLKVCAPPVVSSVDSGKCAQGEIFESTNQCCLVPPADGAGCTIFQVDLRSCQ